MKKLSIIFIAGLFTLALYLNPVSAEAEVSSGTVPEAEMTVPAVTTAAPANEEPSRVNGRGCIVERHTDEESPGFAGQDAG